MFDCNDNSASLVLSVDLSAPSKQPETQRTLGELISEAVAGAALPMPELGYPAIGLAYRRLLRDYKRVNDANLEQGLPLQVPPSRDDFKRQVMGERRFRRRQSAERTFPALATAFNDFVSSLEAREALGEHAEASLAE